MADWFERWRRRQREIAEGADADLLPADGFRFRVALTLVAVGFGLMVLGVKLHLSATFTTVFRVIAATSIVIGFALLKWAQGEGGYLARPDLEGPREIFRGK